MCLFNNARLIFHILDIIIGAPYENDGSGVVYVYNGGQLGVSPFYTQRISPLTHGWGVTGFGFAISELNGKCARNMPLIIHFIYQLTPFSKFFI